jgi:hypothetical protein
MTLGVVLALLSSMSPVAQGVEAGRLERGHAEYASHAEEHAAAHQARLAHLEVRVAGATRKSEEAQAHAAWANELLAHACPAALSSLVLGDDRRADHQAVRTAIQESFEHLDRAAALLDEPEAVADTAPADDDRADAKALRRQIEQLRRFAMAMESVAVKHADEADRGKAIQAARDLAVARESEEPQVASAALFWQSAAWASGGRSDRALKSLPAITDAPEHWPWDFFAIVLRCRLLEEENRPAAALALAIQLEERASAWSGLPAPSESIGDTAILLQLEILERWLEDDAMSVPAARDNLEAIRKHILSEADLPENGDAAKLLICFFEPAVPILVAITPPSHEGQSASRPAPDVVEENNRPITTSAPATAVP